MFGNEVTGGFPIGRK